MRVALAAHDDVLRAAIEERGGWLFKHTGDGVCAAFGSPKAAVDAAVAAQRSLQLPVRMGIATGEAELRGEDYFGVALNRAARVMAAGHGGQILVADSTTSLLSGVDLTDLGMRRLRDLPTPLGLFQVRADGLRSEFPPLRTLDATPGNLRPQPADLIGRESELSDVITAVKLNRLVTLTGVGGVGKTRLAMEVGTRLATEFPDGVWVFELASVADPAALPDAVASVLGTIQQPGVTIAESVAAALDGRVRLLVFDNCEHILDAAADLIELILARSPTVSIIATSREGLAIADEQLWPVRSLDVNSAADLFVERARNALPTFVADDDAAVAEICRRLDGIPLAIELAASRMASMTAAEVRDRLDDRFKLLTGSRRGLERHQTLRHAVQWSYDLLDEPEKMLLEKCSVFAGGFDLESVCAVAGYDDEYRALDLLDALVRKSLLVTDRSSGRTRYSILETIRQFAEDQLVARGEADSIRAAHSGYFAARESDILALWDGPRQREAYAWFARELANVRVAFRRAADHGDVDAAAAISTYGLFLGGGSENYEPIAWAEEIIAPARAIGHPRLAVLYVIASQCWMPGRIEDAVRYSETAQGEIDWERVDLPFGIDGWLAGSYINVGRVDEMVDWCRARLERHRDTHTLTRTCLALALTIRGSTADAMTIADGLGAAAGATGNPYAHSFGLFVEGSAFEASDPTRALDALRRGFAIAQDSGNRFIETGSATALARLEAEYGDPLAALDYSLFAIRNYGNAGNLANMRVAQVALAMLLARLGHHKPAATITGFALSPVTAGRLAKVTEDLREVLGDDGYDSSAREGESMALTTIVNYAYEQIDLIRADIAPPD
jgi:predicted ATPase